MSLRQLPTWGNAGAAMIEFAIIAPIFCLLIAGMVDLGIVLITKSRLDNAVSSASNYALVNASNADSVNGAGLAGAIASIVSSSRGPGWADSIVVVNNGPSAAIINGTPALGGNPVDADSCYCPIGSPPDWTWGAAVPCGSDCPGGAMAGKFVTIRASRAFHTLFFNYGIVRDGAIATSALVQVQ